MSMRAPLNAFTLPTGPSPQAVPRRRQAEIREACCAKAEEWRCCASLLTRIKISGFAGSARDGSCETAWLPHDLVRREAGHDLVRGGLGPGPEATRARKAVLKA